MALVLQDPTAAEEVSRLAYVRLRAHWRSPAVRDRPQLWVRRIAVDLARRRRLPLRTPRGGPTPDVGSPWTGEVMEALALLPLSQRAVAVLHHHEGLALEDVATVLGCSTGAVQQHLDNLDRRLGTLLDKGARADVGR
jgi:RNA polymerase sigma-70 factor (ECF subfamily)